MSAHYAFRNGRRANAAKLSRNPLHMQEKVDIYFYMKKIEQCYVNKQKTCASEYFKVLRLNLRFIYREIPGVMKFPCG